jgi:hypothetical protein
MVKYLLMLTLFCFLSFISLSQTNNLFQKECRISTGIGFGNVTQNEKSAGKYIWVQLNYILSEKFSIATEFENMGYKLPGYYDDLPVNPNEVKVAENNFSLLIKYHFPSIKRIQFLLASGWSFNIQQNDYYIYEKTVNTQHWFRNVTSSSDYSIPFLAEVAYPVFKNIILETRLKYNLNRQNRNTYAAGLGLSLKL